MKTEIRKVTISKEFEEYYVHLDLRTREKYDYVIKKDTKQYKGEIKKAHQILKGYI